MLERVWRNRNSPTWLVGIYWRVHNGEQYGDFLKSWKRSYHVILQSHSWIYIWRKVEFKHTCAPVFTAALFMTAKTWSQPKCPSAGKWIKKMWYIHMVEYYSAIRMNEITPCAVTWVDLEINILSEISQTKTNIICYHLYVESKKTTENVHIR